jgi:type III secretion protein U
MSDDNSEEKDLPATEHSLRKAREKGQVAQSKDFVTMSVTLGAMFYVLSAWRQFVGVFNGGLTYAVIEIDHASDEVFQRVVAVSIGEATRVLTPLVAVMVMVIVLSNVMHKRGIPFSTHPIIPDFKKINPASGLKKMFGARAAAEFGTSLLKLMIWLATVYMLVWRALPDVLNSPVCDTACVANASADLLKKLLIAAIILLLISGILDLPLQVALFRRENRMSQTQMKRENKETQGSPEFKSFRKDAHRRLQQGAPGGSGKRTPLATLVITGADIAIAIRFNPQDAPVPTIVARGRGPLGDDIVKSATKLGVPVEHDAALALNLYRTGLPGQQIEARFFQSVAQLIVKNGGN